MNAGLPFVLKIVSAPSAPHQANCSMAQKYAEVVSLPDTDLDRHPSESDMSPLDLRLDPGGSQRVRMARCLRRVAKPARAAERET